MDDHERTAVRRQPSFLTLLCHLCCILWVGDALPTTAFMFGRESFDLLSGRTTRSRDVLRELTTKKSSVEFRQDDYDDDRQFAVTDMQGRRACLASLTFGATAVIKAGSAYAKENNNDLDKSLPLTATQSPNLSDIQSPITITLPLEPSSGGTLCVRVTVFTSHDGTKHGGIFSGGADNLDDSFRVLRAIVDTGSPYLVLPSSGPESSKRNIAQWTKAAFASQDMEPSLRLSSSEYSPTEEIYGAVKGEINWKLARYTFRDPRLIQNKGENQLSSTLSFPNNDVSAAAGVVGVLDDALTNEATGGGMVEPYALLGLIQNNNPDADRNRFPDPRPSFLEQERISTADGDDNHTTNEGRRIKSFSINGPLREMTLSTQSLIPATTPAMPLVDLRSYGDFVDHYAVVVDSISFDDVSVSSQNLKDFSGSAIDRPIVAVFDTGLTGCLLIRPFWDVLQKYLGGKSPTVDEFRSVALSMSAAEKQRRNSGISNCNIKSSLEEDRRFYVQPIDLDWFDDEESSPYVIVLGQTFLSRGALTTDIDERMATFNSANS